jgi:uncharacterized protein YqjF (DUF2071 family)
LNWSCVGADDRDRTPSFVLMSQVPGRLDAQQVMTMNRQSKFLTAEWSNVLMLNYAVDSTLLQQFVPRGTELDTFDGKTYLSLVGFEFNRTRMFGLSVPFHQSFEEVNLRF